MHPDFGLGPVLFVSVGPSVSVMSTFQPPSSVSDSPASPPPGFGPDSPASRTPDSAPAASRPPAVGLSLVTVVVLALLAVPRVILHDLDLVHEGTFVNLLLVFVPLAIWIVVTLRARVERPFTTLLAVGGLYGVLLAGTHQVLWAVGLDNAAPRLGGNLADLSPGVQDVIFRVAGTISSLGTGLLVGAVTGVVALGLTAMLRRTDRA